MELIEKLKQDGIVSDNPDSSRAVAETLGQMSLAKKFPRNLKEVEAKIKKICSSRDFAETAFWTQKRNNKEVTGPSIRLAEAVASAMGNINYGISSHPDEFNKDATSYKVYVLDLETNTRVDRSFIRAHKRKANGKIIKVTDPQSQYELIASDASRRLRACFLNILPGHLVNLAENLCRETLNADNVPHGTIVERIVQSFATHNIVRSEIEEKIGKQLDDLNNEDLEKLRGIVNVLRQGTGTKETFFSRPKEVVDKNKNESKTDNTNETRKV